MPQNEISGMKPVRIFNILYLPLLPPNDSAIFTVREVNVQTIAMSVGFPFSTLNPGHNTFR